MSLHIMVRAVFRPEAELTLFLRMCIKECAKNFGKTHAHRRIVPILHTARSSIGLVSLSARALI